MDRIPPALAPLVEDAKQWAIVGETGIERAIKKASPADLESVPIRAQSLREEISQFAHESKGAREVPVPDEVVLFQIYLGVVGEIDSTVRLKKSRTKS